MLCLYLASFLNFFALAITLVPTISKICTVLAGSPAAVTADTAFVTVNCFVLGNVFKLIFAKWDAALSDHVGRKLVMVMSCAAFAVRCGLILSAKSAGAFYAGAIVFGALDVYYAVAIAYLADMTGEERGKAIGVQTGISVGLGFTIGVPLGAVLQDADLSLPFYVAIAAIIAAALVSIAIPHPDIAQARHLPPLSTFLRDHHPFTGFGLMRSANVSPLDWATNFGGQCAQQVLQSCFILFLEGSLGYTPAQAGEAFAVVGVSIAVASPLLIGRYEERPLVALGMALQIASYFLLSLAGTSWPGAAYVAIPSFVGLSVGATWLSALPSIITKQYDKQMYGSVVGVLSQQTVLASLPAYPVGLLFAYTLTSPNHLYWPGSTWVFAAFFLMLAIYIQLFAHGAKALALKKRSRVVADSSPDDVPGVVVVNPLLVDSSDLPDDCHHETTPPAPPTTRTYE